MRIIRFAIVFAAASLCACASLVSGTTQEATFRSSPEGATVIVGGRVIGKTPISALLKKNEHDIVSFEKPGYQRLTLPMNKRLDGWFWGNIVIGGVLGSTTDSVSGAAYEYSPNQFIVTLTPSGARAFEREAAVGQAVRARQFIVAGYPSIVRDLRAGKGEYSDSLLKVLAVPEPDKVAALKRLAALTVAYPDIVDFADKAIELYSKYPATSTEDQQVVDSADPMAERFRLLCAEKRTVAEVSVNKLKPEQRTALTDYIFRTKGLAAATEETFAPSLDLPEAESRCVDWYIRTFTEYARVAR